MDNYQRGLEQFTQMVGADRIETLVERFRAVCPDFETEVVSVVGGRIWTRPGIDLKTRSLCSICVLAALGRGDRDPTLPARLAALRDEARGLGLLNALPRMAAALAEL